MVGSNDNADSKQPAVLDAASVEGYVADALAVAAAVSLTAGLKQMRFDHAGDHSPPVLVSRGIDALSSAGRKEVGARTGRVHDQVSQAVAAWQEELIARGLAQTLVVECIGMTLPMGLTPRGGLYPTTTLIDDIYDVFPTMDWEVVEDPGLEAEWYNFDVLNLGVDHPVRDEQSTLWAEPAIVGELLHTQAFPV